MAETLLSIIILILLALEPKFLFKQNLRSLEQEAKNFFSTRLLGVIVSGTIPFSTPWFLDTGILALGEDVPYVGC